MTPIQLLDVKSQETHVRETFGIPPEGLRAGRTLGNAVLQHTSEFRGRGFFGLQTRMVASRVPSRRQVELQWRRTNRELLRRYLGQWVVLEGERIVASDRSLAEVVRRARETGVRVPYVFRVEDLDQDVVRIGL